MFKIELETFSHSAGADSFMRMIFPKNDENTENYSQIAAPRKRLIRFRSTLVARSLTEYPFERRAKCRPMISIFRESIPFLSNKS